VPLRAVPVLTATLNATVPLPAPDAPLVTVSQGTLAAAVQAHDPAEAVTVVDPVPPVSDTDCAPGAIANVHGGGGGAACDTVNVCPAMVSVPLRAVPGLAAALNAIVPLPVPEAPLVTVSQGALAVAVHAHDAAEAVTVVEPVPPGSDIDCAVGAIVNVHGGGGGGAAAAWVTVNVFPAATIVADRVEVAVLAATAKATVPLPVPDSPDVRLIHGTLVDAVHTHVPDEAVTAIEPDAPASPTFCDAGEIENVQAGGGAAACEIVNVLPATVIVAVRAAPPLADTR
jgi:hypothetical protein